MTDTDLGCDCSDSCDYDYDLPRIYNEKIHRARKEYRCLECPDPIKPGDQYARISLLSYDEDWSTYHICIGCYRIGKDLADGCWILGSLRETIDECLGLDYWKTGPDDEEEE